MHQLTDRKYLRPIQASTAAPPRASSLCKPPRGLLRVLPRMAPKRKAKVESAADSEAAHVDSPKPRNPKKTTATLATTDIVVISHAVNETHTHPEQVSADVAAAAIASAKPKRTNASTKGKPAVKDSKAVETDDDGGAVPEGEGTEGKGKRKSKSAAAALPVKKPRGKKVPSAADDEGDGDEGEAVQGGDAKPKPSRKKGPASNSGGGDEGGEGGPTSPPFSGYWLMKNEPDELSMDILKSKPDKTAYWDGVRNYQARNFMRNMKIGDQIIFYYSSCKVPGIAGIVKVVKLAYPDHTAWDPKSPYYDAKSDPDNPRWDMVDVQYVEEMPRFLTLEELRRHSGPGGVLEGMLLFTRFRLSVMPLSKQHWDSILELAKGPAPPPTVKEKKPRKKKDKGEEGKGKEEEEEEED